MCSYETRLAWLHKLRRAMVRPERELLGRVSNSSRASWAAAATASWAEQPKKASIIIAVARLAYHLDDLPLL